MSTTNGPEESKAKDTCLPNSKKIYISGKLHPDVRVPFREISLSPTKSISGPIESSAGASPVILQNEPVRVYDTSGPWGDPSVTLDPVQGLPPLRRDWIVKRGDVDEIEGRVVRPIDDGYLSEVHARSQPKRRTSNGQRPMPGGNGSNGKLSTLNYQASTAAQRRPLRARA